MHVSLLERTLHIAKHHWEDDGVVTKRRNTRPTSYMVQRWNRLLYGRAGVLFIPHNMETSTQYNSIQQITIRLQVSAADAACRRAKPELS